MSKLNHNLIYSRAAVDCTPSQLPSFLPFLHKILPSTLYIISPMHLQLKFEVATSNGLGDTFYKTIHYMTLTLGTRSHKTLLPSTLHLVWPMHLQSFKWLHATVKKIHLQESTLFVLNLGVKVTQKVALSAVPSTSCDLCTWPPAKFEVATSNGLRGYAVTKIYIIWPWTWGQGHTKCCPVPSTSCDLCICKVLSCYVQQFRRRCIYKKYIIRPSPWVKVT